MAATANILDYIQVNCFCSRPSSCLPTDFIDWCCFDWIPPFGNYGSYRVDRIDFVELGSRRAWRKTWAWMGLTKASRVAVSKWNWFFLVIHYRRMSHVKKKWTATARCPGIRSTARGRCVAGATSQVFTSMVHFHFISGFKRSMIFFFFPRATRRRVGVRTFRPAGSALAWSDFRLAPLFPNWTNLVFRASYTPTFVLLPLVPNGNKIDS